MTTLSNPFKVLITLALVGHGVVSQAQSLPVQTRGELLYTTHCLQKSMPSSSSLFVRLEGERARVAAILSNILPLSTRQQGIAGDMAVVASLVSTPLETLRLPTLIMAARDDGFGTYASAQYTASRIAGAKFIGFNEGGHALVGHNHEIIAEVAKLVKQAGP